MDWLSTACQCLAMVKQRTSTLVYWLLGSRSYWLRYKNKSIHFFLSHAIFLASSECGLLTAMNVVLFSGLFTNSSVQRSCLCVSGLSHYAATGCCQRPGSFSGIRKLPHSGKKFSYMCLRHADDIRAVFWSFGSPPCTFFVSCSNTFELNMG